MSGLMEKDHLKVFLELKMLLKSESILTLAKKETILRTSLMIRLKKKLLNLVKRVEKK